MVLIALALIAWAFFGWLSNKLWMVAIEESRVLAFVGGILTGYISMFALIIAVVLAAA